MNNEFKKFKSNTETRYVLETMTAGGTGTGSVASVTKSLGGVQKRNQDNILAQEGDKITVPVKQKPRQGPLRPQTGGGAHRDKKKEQKQGKEKHRKPFAEGIMEPDHEISMASNELQSIVSDAKKLLMLIKRYSEMEGLEAWQQSKITKAADYVASVLRSIGGEQGALEAYGRRSNYYNPMDYERDQQDQMDWDKRAFKRAELQHELGHEDEPYRPRSRYSSSASRGMYFYNVKPGQESDAMKAGLKQSKSGKWYSTFSNPTADKMFGAGRFWQPKNESMEEGLRDPKDNPCWKGYKPVGTKKKGGRTVPNCVPKEGVAEEQGYDEVSPKSASYILRKLDQGVPMSSILDDFPELGRMMEIIAGEQGLHPDDDFEQIEDILMNDLEDIAAQEDDFGDYDRDEEQPDEYMESLAQFLESAINEKAVSKAQQRFMGMVHAAQKGEKPASKEVAKAAKGMSKKDAKDFAATKHKGLPEKKSKK